MPVGATITNISYHKATSFGSVAPEHTLEVLFRETTTDSYTSGDTLGNILQGASQVFYSSNFGMPQTTGWVNFGPFQNAHVYQGGNLEVVILWDCSGSAGNPTTGAFSWSWEPYSGGLGRGYGNVCGAPGNNTNISNTGIGVNARYPVVRFEWTPPAGDSVYISQRTTPSDSMPANADDEIVLDLEAQVFNSNQTLDSITFTKLGSVPDNLIDVKLVHDINDNGAIDASDPVLGTGVVTNGTITFNLTTPLNVTTSAPVRLLLAVSASGAFPPMSDLSFEIETSADITWSGGNDITPYPVSGTPRPVPMAGSYTISNGNPGGAYDFGDIGDAFDALEKYGISGPVTFDIYDTGGDFTSSASYTLGISAAGTASPIAGSSVANLITLRAAAGNRPHITGNGAVAPWSSRSGTIALNNVTGVLIEGLEISGGTFYGISLVRSGQSSFINDITIRRCKIHSINGPAVIAWANGGGMNRINVEGCFIYDCNLINTGGFSSRSRGLVAISQVTGPNVVRDNTIVHAQGSSDTAGVFLDQASAASRDIQLHNNIIVNALANAHCVKTTQTGRFVGADYNLLYATAGEIFDDNGTDSDFAAWQGGAGGRDANGLNADPQLIDITPGSMNLRLTSTSPAINAGDPGSTATLDIDGDARPNGDFDIGADEAYIPGIAVEYNNTPVANGGDVDVGSLPFSGDAFTFTIISNGTVALDITGNVTITLGNNLAAGTIVQSQPASTTLQPQDSTTFTVFVEPAGSGDFDLEVSIPSNDSSQNPFEFTVEGSGNAPAEASLPAGSSFTGSAGGPFSMEVQPGETLADAEIQLTDPESDDITVTAITLITATPTGISAPAIPAPGHPIVLEWTGTADASNTPGIYTWEIDFEDAVNGTPMSVVVNIEILDIPPTHTIEDADSGDGSAGSPYTTTYTAGMTAATTVNLASVSSPNTGQTVSITNYSQVSGPSGTGFDFTLSAGLLVVAPGGTLDAADVGAQNWLVEITDGTHDVDIYVEVTVNPAIEFTVSTTLPDALQNAPYSETVTTTGGTGQVTLAVTSGSLPSGMNMTSAGVISGTSTSPQNATFTITATDSLGAQTAEAFNLDVIVPPDGLPTITTTSLPIGAVDFPYGPEQIEVSGGLQPYTFQIVSGALPAGLSMNSSGAISGTPTEVVTANFTVRVTDSANVSTQQGLSIEIRPAASGGGSGSGGGGGCSGTGGGTGLWLLLALLPAALLLRREYARRVTS
jgi:hypothetical protein